MLSLNADGKSEKGLIINTFGSFRVTKDGSCISNSSGRSRKMWDLFKYFITMRDRKLSVSDCYDAIWGEEDSSTNPSGALQNLIYRLRNTIGDSKGSEQSHYIIYAGSCYSWNAQSDYWLDSQAFEECAFEAELLRGKEPEKAIELYMTAIDLYQGDYLPELMYNHWVDVSRNKFSRIFNECGKALAELLRKAERYQEILDLCEKVFTLDSMDDTFHAIYIDALIDMERIVQAQAHYRYATSLLYREMGIKPTAILRQTYTKIKKFGGLKHADLALVQAKLNETSEVFGAFYCDVEVFRAIYRLESRRMPRQGYSQFLCLATLVNESEQAVSGEEMKEIVDMLIKLAVQAMRAGDVVSKWSEDQLVFLLPSIKVEDNSKVMQRIEDQYNKHRRNQRVNVRLEYASLMQV